MGKFGLPNNGSEIAAKFTAEFKADNAKFQSKLKSLFETKAPGASQPTARKNGAWTALPRYHRDHGGEFYERLSTPLHTAEQE